MPKPSARGDLLRRALADEEIETLAGEGYDGKAQPFYGDISEKLRMTNLLAATIDDRLSRKSSNRFRIINTLR